MIDLEMHAFGSGGILVAWLCSSSVELKAFSSVENFEVYVSSSMLYYYICIYCTCMTFFEG